MNPIPRAERGEPLEDIRVAVLRLKRERIVAAASDLFYSDGFGNTTLDAVARQLNVTKPFIYSHFSSKSQLLAEICSHGIRASLDVLNRVLATDDSPTDKLQALVRDFLLAVLRNQKNIAIYTRETKHLAPADAEAINGLRREFDGKFHALLRQGADSGEFVVGDAQLASLAIGGIVSWSYVWYRPDGRLPPAEAADRICDLVLAMVQAGPARRKKARGVACTVA
jgi:AcrR family transcriptional regulator